MLDPVGPVPAAGGGADSAPGARQLVYLHTGGHAAGEQHGGGAEAEGTRR